MQKRSVVVISLLAAVSLPASSAEQSSNPDVRVAQTRDENTVAAASKVTVKATVLSIEAPSRTLTLKGPRGNIFDIVAGDEVKNFDQIKVQDTLNFTYVEALAFELKKVHGKIRERREVDDGATAKPGEKPGAAAGKRIIVVADVVRIDHKKQTVALRGPKHTVTLKVADPKNLKDVKAGDQVEVTYIQAVAVDIESPTTPKN